MDFTNPLTMHTDVQDLFGGMVAARKTLTEGGYSGEEAFALVGSVFSGVISAKLHEEIHHPRQEPQETEMPAGIPPELAEVFSRIQSGGAGVKFVDLNNLASSPNPDDLSRFLKDLRGDEEEGK